MNKAAKISLFLLRLGLGWVMFYAGITKILNPAWTAAPYLANAKTFGGFFEWLVLPGNIGWVNFLNEWGLALIGLSLIFGLGVRLASIFGALLMVLYYLPVLQFPYVSSHSFIVDDHIIYALAFVFFAAVRAGRVYGLEKWCANLPICKRYPKLHNLWG